MYCPKCGTEVPSNSSFCPKCGFNISAPSSSPETPTNGPGPFTPAPDNHMALAIITTILCCVPLGIVSIVKASKVESLWAMGQHQAAQKNADDAKKYAIIGMIISAVVVVIYVIAYVVFAVSLFDL